MHGEVRTAADGQCKAWFTTNDWQGGQARATDGMGMARHGSLSIVCGEEDLGIGQECTGGEWTGAERTGNAMSGYNSDFWRGKDGLAEAGSGQERICMAWVPSQKFELKREKSWTGEE